MPNPYEHSPQHTNEKLSWKLARVRKHVVMCIKKYETQRKDNNQNIKPIHLFLSAPEACNHLHESGRSVGLKKTSVEFLCRNKLLLIKLIISNPVMLIFNYICIWCFYCTMHLNKKSIYRFILTFLMDNPEEKMAWKTPWDDIRKNSSWVVWQQIIINNYKSLQYWGLEK